MRTRVYFLVQLFWFLFAAMAPSAEANFRNNNLHRFDRQFKGPSISKEGFDKSIDFIVGLWQPIARLRGVELVAVKDWDNPTVNAHALQNGSQWILKMYGGLARRPELTADGWLLVVCHELGHHFGGYFYLDGIPWDYTAEGEADYWATHVCARQVFARVPTPVRDFAALIAPPLRQLCDGQFADARARQICYRTTVASTSLGNVLAAIDNQPVPRFETPDRSSVSQSDGGHPPTQCRLDTLWAGTLCNTPFDLKSIPGKGLPQGHNSTAAEQVALVNSCTRLRGQTLGLRPQCWFHSQLEGPR